MDCTKQLKPICCLKNHTAGIVKIFSICAVADGVNP
jgi:hypothetical protein